MVPPFLLLTLLCASRVLAWTCPFLIGSIFLFFVWTTLSRTPQHFLQSSIFNLRHTMIIFNHSRDRHTSLSDESVSMEHIFTSRSILWCLPVSLFNGSHGLVQETMLNLCRCGYWASADVVLFHCLCTPASHKTRTWATFTQTGLQIPIPRNKSMPCLLIDVNHLR